MDKLKSQYEDELDALKKKLRWYTENQELMDQNDALLKQRETETRELREKLREARESEGSSSRVKELERRNRELEEALKKRHPNSLPQMIHAAKPSAEE